MAIIKRTVTHSDIACLLSLVTALDFTESKKAMRTSFEVECTLPFSTLTEFLVNLFIISRNYCIGSVVQQQYQQNRQNASRSRTNNKGVLKQTRWLNANHPYE